MKQYSMQAQHTQVVFVVNQNTIKMFVNPIQRIMSKIMLISKIISFIFVVV